MWNYNNEAIEGCELADQFSKHYTKFTSSVDDSLEDKISKVNLILLVIGTYIFYMYGINWIRKNIFEMSIVTVILKALLAVPGLNILANYGLSKGNDLLGDALDKMLFNSRGEVVEEIPEAPLKPEVVRDKIIDFHNKHYEDYSTGLHSGTIYHSESAELNNAIEVAMEAFHDSNTAEPEIFKGVAQLNADIINNTIRLFNGDADTQAMTTCGGTESICCAIAAYKLMALKKKGITKPNLVFYDSAHAAFMKACEYFNIEMRRIPMNMSTYTSPEPLRKYIDSNTIAIVASGCNFAHGAIDDVVQFGKMAQEYGIGLHVDNCLGGFVNCFGDEFRTDMFAFDFRAKGVTSISCDTHKYGYGPKGMSVLLMRPKELFDNLKYTSVSHAGAPFTMGNFGTNRSGSIIAGTWAAMMKTGYKNYVQKTKNIFETAKYLREEVSKIPEMKLFGPNNGLNMVCFEGVGINSISVSLKMKELSKWHLSECHSPCVLHLLVSDSNIKMADKFLTDLKIAIKDVKAQKTIKKSGYQTLYGTSCIITDPSMISKMLYVLIDGCYATTSRRARLSLNI